MADRLLLPRLLVSQLARRRQFSSSAPLRRIQKETQMRIVDNSAIGQQSLAVGRPPRVIHVYTKNGKGTIGDKVLVAILGQKRRGYIVGVKRQSFLHGLPRMDTNNLVLIADNGSPLGTRITAPLPACLRKLDSGDFSKILALATTFV